MNLRRAPTTEQKNNEQNGRNKRNRRRNNTKATQTKEAKARQAKSEQDKTGQGRPRETRPKADLPIAGRGNFPLELSKKLLFAPPLCTSRRPSPAPAKIEFEFWTGYLDSPCKKRQDRSHETKSRQNKPETPRQDKRDEDWIRKTKKRTINWRCSKIHMQPPWRRSILRKLKETQLPPNFPSLIVLKCSFASPTIRNTTALKIVLYLEAQLPPTST